MEDTNCAFDGFERLDNAVNGREQQARSSKGLVFRKAKGSLPEFRFVGQFNRTLSSAGFFAPSNVVMDTIANGLASGSFH